MTCKECGHKVKRLPHRLAKKIKIRSFPLLDLGCGTGSVEYDEISACIDSESANFGNNYLVGTVRYRILL